MENSSSVLQTCLSINHWIWLKGGARSVVMLWKDNFNMLQMKKVNIRYLMYSFKILLTSNDDRSYVSNHLQFHCLFNSCVQLGIVSIEIYRLNAVGIPITEMSHLHIGNHISEKIRHYENDRRTLPDILVVLLLSKSLIVVLHLGLALPTNCVVDIVYPLNVTSSCILLSVWLLIFDGSKIKPCQ